MEKKKVNSNRSLYILVTENSSFGSSEEEAMVLPLSPSILPSLESDELALVGDVCTQDQQQQVSGNRKSREGWLEMSFSVDKPQRPSPTVKQIRPRSFKIKHNERNYRLQISPTSTAPTHKSDGKTKSGEKRPHEKNQPECHFEYLTPIEKEAQLRYERRMKQKQDREKNRDEIFFF